ncbi:MAG TPA: SCP2 sterol-binding domain-containing protein [Acidimicrobiales bacterium]|nr:SCP2 sterol-binding domain-containing protein [Acidimicrobiales bacterium]
MAAFLSDEWMAALNRTLSAAGPAPLVDPSKVFRLVLEFTDGSSNAPHALTFCVSATGSTADVGDHLAADAVIRLSYADAEALTKGTLDSASALREGRLKVRGDVHSLVPLLAWLHASKQTPA